MRRLLAAPLAVAVLFGGCGEGGEAAQAGEQAGRGGPGRGGPGGRMVAVETSAVEKGSIARAVTVSGVIEPIRTVGVNSQLSGALLAVEVEEGDVVGQGAVLARLDDRELSSQLASAEAAFQVASAALERAERLKDRQVITLPEYERDRASFAAARAQLEQLRTRIGYATVRAPSSGIVTEKRVEAGDVVAPQTRLFTLADVSTLVVRVGISELDVVELGVGEAAEVVLDAYPERALRGRIRRIFPTADPTTRLVPVEVALEAESARTARPGFLARITFALGTRSGVLLVPASAIVSGAGSEAVFIVDEGRAVRRSVSTGLTSAGQVEIVSGLDAGAQVVTAGNNMLRDGMEVRVVSRADTAAEPGGGESHPNAGRQSP